jgi:hypothetical protein
MSLSVKGTPESGEAITTVVVCKVWILSKNTSGIIICATGIWRRRLRSRDTIQGGGQILHFIKHWRTDTIISSTLRIDVAWCQWQAGTSTSILATLADILYLEARWIPSLREALRNFGAILVTDNEFVPCPERDDDKYIMDVANGDKQFTDKDIRIINYCQLYLHITTISEMYDADGHEIMPHIWRCTRPPWFDANTNVAIQRRPSDHQIRTRWNKMCKLAQQHGVSGAWILPLRMRRETYCLAGSDKATIYHWYAGSYWACSSAQMVNEQFRLILLRPTEWVPSTVTDVPVCIKARVHCTIYTRITTQSYQTPTMNQQTSPEHTFCDYIKEIPEWKRQLLQGINWVHDFNYVLRAMTNMPEELSLLVVSDGSAHEGQHMSFGVTIGLQDG